MFSIKAFINKLKGVKTGNQQLIPLKVRYLYAILTGTCCGYFYASFFINKNKEFSSHEYLIPY